MSDKGILPAIRSFSLLGVTVTPLTIPDLIGVVESAIKENHDRSLIANHNLHSVSLHHRDPEMRAFYEMADYTFIDGMPIIAHANLMGIPLRREHRITSIDWLPPLLTMSQQYGWRVVFVGGTPLTVSIARQKLIERFPNLKLFVHHGYFDINLNGRSNQSVLQFVRSREPNIILVGMGMPRQEHWILENIPHLRANVLISIGAGMDYIAGALPTSPRWMGRIGLEWLHRLLSEPRRLSGRYLVEPWNILPLAVRDYRSRYGRNGSQPRD